MANNIAKMFSSNCYGGLPKQPAIEVCGHPPGTTNITLYNTLLVLVTTIQWTEKVTLEKEKDIKISGMQTTKER